MTQSRRIIIELRAMAAAGKAPDVVRAMRRAADELERQEDELFYLRAYTEMVKAA